MRQVPNRQRKKKTRMRNLTKLRAILVLLAIPSVILPGMASTVIPTFSGNTSSANSHVWTVNVRELPLPARASVIPQTNNGIGPRNIGWTSNTPFRGHGGIQSASKMATLSSSTVYAYTGFDGLVNFQGCNCAPPDVQVAAGPNHVVEMVNLAGEVFNKTGSSLQIFDLGAFFHTGSDFISDPKIMYDSSSGVWFATIIDVDQVPAFTRGAVQVAVSTTSDPTGTWNVYSFSSGTSLPDQPLPGISDDKFVFNANLYSQTAFLGAKWWVINKNDLVTGASNPRFAPFGPYATLESLYPVQSSTSTTTQYMVSTGASDLSNNSTSIKLFSITGVPGVSTVQNTNTTLSVSHVITRAPSGAEPSGNSVDTVDQRVQTAAWSNGNLWLGFNDACIPTGDTATHACARLTEISTGLTPSITQDFDYGAAHTDYFFPALRIDGSGNLQLIYGFSSSTTHPSLAVTGQATTDPLGSLAPSVTVKSGNADDFFGRYGDYFGAGLDPIDTAVVWVAGEYHTTTSGSCDAFGESCWSTFVDRLSFNDFSFTVSPSSVTFNPGGSGRVNVTATTINGYNGTLSLLGTGPAGIGVTCNPTSLVLGSSATSTCTITGSNPGSFATTIAATAGPRTRTVTVTATVSGFTLSTAHLLTLPGGSAGHFIDSIFVSAFGTFSGSVSLTNAVSPVVTNGPIATLSPTSGTPPFSTNLNVSITSSTPTGLYMISVTGSAGGVNHSVYIAFAVTPISTSLNSTITFTGVKVKVTGTVNVGTSSSLTLSGSPSVTATNASTGATLFTRTYTLVNQPLTNTTSGTFSATFLLPIYVNPYTLSSNIQVSVSGNTITNSYSVTRDLDINNDGIVNLADLNIASAAFGCSIGQQCYNPKADVNADGKVDISDIATMAANYLAPALIADFTISASRISVSFRFQSTPPNVTITVTSINGFAGTANLSVKVYRGGTFAEYSGLGTTINPTSLTVSSGGSASSTLTFNQQVCPVIWTVVVSGTSGSISHSVSISVRDFSCPL